MGGSSRVPSECSPLRGTLGSRHSVTPSGLTSSSRTQPAKHLVSATVVFVLTFHAAGLHPAALLPLLCVAASTFPQSPDCPTLGVRAPCVCGSVIAGLLALPRVGFPWFERTFEL